MNDVCLLSISPETLSDWRSHLLDDEQDGHIAAHVATCNACKVVIGQHERIARSLRDLPTHLTGSEVWATLKTQIGTKRLLPYQQPGLLQRYGMTATIVLLFLVFFTMMVRQNAESTHMLLPTPTPLQTPSPTSQPEPFSGPPSYSNPMTSDRQDGWDSLQGSPYASCTFADDGYHVMSAPSYGNLCGNPQLDRPNFAIQVQMTFVQGTDSDWGGINFRGVGSDGGAGYDFDVQADGHYILTRCANLNCSYMIAHGVAADFHRGLHQPNILGIVARGASLSIYLNHVLLQRATDTHLQNGFIGLLSGPNNDHTTTEVVYRDFMEWDY